MKLWDYQKGALKKLIEHFKNYAVALMVMATGLGKTRVAAHWAKTITIPRVTRGLVLCHETEILEQDLAEFREVFGESVSLGVFHGGEKTFEKVEWLFATFQTMIDWKDAFFPEEFDFLIVDESHHGQAPTHKEVIEYFKPKKMLGMTATPDRMDEKDIREIFGEEVVNIQLAEAIAKGWLTQVEYRLIADNLNRYALNKLFQELIADTSKRVSMKQLNETLFIEARDEEVAKIILAENKKTIIFCENIKHCENFAKFIPGSYAYHSKRSSNDNAQAMKKFKSNGLQYILAVDKFNEGVDVPDAELIVFLRATDSRTIFWQQLGRGLRKIFGKEKVIVMDFVANCERLIVVKELTDQVKQIAKRELVKDMMHVKGKFFDFVFTREDLDIFEVIERVMQRRTIADIPYLLAEYMPPPKNDLPANEIIAGTHKKLWWKCGKENCGHEWQAQGSGRVLGRGCPACSNRLVTARNNLAITHPELAKEYMPPPKNELPADKIIAGTHKKLWWKCGKENCGHEWQARGVKRSLGNGCPACLNKVVTEKNNLVITHPELAKEYMPPPKNRLPACEIIAGTYEKIWWKCSSEGCGHEWQAIGGSRVNGGTGCPACKNRVITAKNNLAVTHPELAKEYMPPPKNELPVDQVSAGLGKKLWWKCLKEECGHEWQAFGSNRVRGSKCPACAGRIHTEKNNLAVTHPELAKEYMSPPKNKLPANRVLVGIAKKVWWKCSKEGCGYEWQSSGSLRQICGCPACSGRVPTEKNNLAVTHPELAKEYMPPPKNELPADKIIAGTGKKVWWKCSKCGHEWQTSGNIRTKGHGCPNYRKHN